MKKIILGVAAVFFLSSCFAQDCKTSLYMTPNAKIGMTVYDRKGAVSGVQTWQVSDVKKSGDAYTSTLRVVFVNDKGKQLSSGGGSYKCSGGVLSADMKMFLPQEQMSKMGESDAKMEPVYLEYPARPAVGQVLKDAEFNMDVTLSSGMSTHISFKEEGRKVEAKESLTTPAGTWDAYIVSYSGSMKTKVMGIGIPFNFTAKEWYVPGMGIIKSETYGKNGKLAGSSLLTSISK